MGIFSIKKREELALVFDVGSSMVSGALFKISEDSAPKIIFSTIEYLPVDKKLNTETFFSATTEALKRVAGKVCTRGLGAPRRIFCVLSSPWFASQTRTVEMQKNEEFLFTSKLVDELIKKEITAFEAEYMKNDDDASSKVRVIEIKNMKTKLNGYDTTHPLNKKAEKIELSLFLSIAEEKVIGAFKEAINQHFHHEKINFSSFMLASFAVARDVFINQDSFILVNIGGEVTDIAMAKAEVLKESISFPLGKNFILRQIAKETDVTLQEAKSYLSLYKDGHFEETMLRKFEPSIVNAKNEWLKNFQEFLSKLTNDISIPSTVFITIDPELAEFFASTIKNEQFNQYILTESKFRVIFLGGQALHGVLLFEGNITTSPGVIVDCIYISHFLR